MNMGVLIWIFHWFIIVFLIKIAMIGENPTFSSIFGHTLFLPVYPAKHVFFVKVGRVCASSMWQQHLWHSFLTSGKVRGRFYVGVVGCSHLKRNHSWDSWKCSSSYKWTYIYTLYIAHIYIYITIVTTFLFQLLGVYFTLVAKGKPQLQTPPTIDHIDLHKHAYPWSLLCTPILSKYSVDYADQLINMMVWKQRCISFFLVI